MCIWTYLYMYICVYVYLCLCKCICIGLCVCIYVSTFICTCTLWGSVDGEMTFIEAASQGKSFHDVADSLYDDVEWYFCSRLKIRHFVQWKTLETNFDSKLDIRKPQTIIIYCDVVLNSLKDEDRI